MEFDNKKSKSQRGRIRMVSSEEAQVSAGAPMDVRRLKEMKIRSGADFTVYGVLGIILVLVYLISFFGFMNYDSDFTIAFFFSRFSQNISDFFAFATGGVNNNMINWRFYKSLIIVLSGMALAAAGAVYKAIYRNTLASPDTMGVQSGGNLGNVIYVMIFTEAYMDSGTVAAGHASTFMDRNLQAIMIFAACFISVILLSLVASTAGRGKMSSSAIVLTGVVFSSIISAFVSLVQYQIIAADPDDPRIDILKQMALGSFDYATTLEQLVTMFIIIAICIAAIFLFMNRMNLYSLGEEEAIAMGMNVRAYKYVMIIPSTILVAIVMSYCGHIAFIAFLVPQIARKLAGTDFRKILICSMLIGGILMTVVYDAALILDMTDALNVLTTSIGGIVMIMILMGRRESRDAVIAE